MPEQQSELLNKVLLKAVSLDASDIHAAPGEPLHFRIDGSLTQEFFACLLYTSPSPRDRG